MHLPLLARYRALSPGGGLIEETELCCGVRCHEQYMGQTAVLTKMERHQHCSSSVSPPITGDVWEGSCPFRRQSPDPCERRCTGPPDSRCPRPSSPEHIERSLSSTRFSHQSSLMICFKGLYEFKGLCERKLHCRWRTVARSGLWHAPSRLPPWDDQAQTGKADDMVHPDKSDIEA